MLFSVTSGELKLHEPSPWLISSTLHCDVTQCQALAYFPFEAQHDTVLRLNVVCRNYSFGSLRPNHIKYLLNIIGKQADESFRLVIMILESMTYPGQSE